MHGKAILMRQGSDAQPDFVASIAHGRGAIGAVQCQKSKNQIRDKLHSSSAVNTHNRVQCFCKETNAAIAKRSLVY